MTETVLVFGASGNLGVAAVIGALRSNRHVIAVVRNQASAAKMFQYVGTRNNITVVEADITSEESVRGIVDKVRAETIPSFQHVWVSSGGLYWETPLLDLDTAAMRECMTVNFETYLYASLILTFSPRRHRATVPYLLEQGLPNSTWTMCTGAQGNIGTRAASSITQGALYSFAIVASRDHEKTNIRFNEVYLAYRVQVDGDDMDESFKGVPFNTSAEYAPVYEQILDRVDIRSSRVITITPEDVKELRYVAKVE